MNQMTYLFKKKIFVHVCRLLLVPILWFTYRSFTLKRNIMRSILSATVVWKSIFVGNIKTAKSVLCDLPIGSHKTGWLLISGLINMKCIIMGNTSYCLTEVVIKAGLTE